MTKQQAGCHMTIHGILLRDYMRKLPSRVQFISKNKTPVYTCIYMYIQVYSVLSTKRVEWVVFQSFDIFSVMVHAIETKNIPT